MLSANVFQHLRTTRDWRWGRTSNCCVIDLESPEMRQAVTRKKLDPAPTRPGSVERSENSWAPSACRGCFDGEGSTAVAAYG